MDPLPPPLLGFLWVRWREEERRRQDDARRREEERRRRWLASRPVRCATCDRRLGDDPDDDPEGDARLPICGECNRARNLDVLLESDELE